MRVPSWLIIIVAAVLVAHLVRAGVRSAKEIAEINDFEVFYRIGQAAAERDMHIYDIMSPVKKRGPFQYPPAGAVFFVPLAWFSQTTAGVIVSIIKVLCLAMLLWGAVKFSGCPPSKWADTIVLMAITALLVYRPTDSDVGNGQVNIILAAAACGGVWLLMISRRWWWIGGTLLAWAIALKMTPALFLAVPLLNRRWKQLAVTIAFTLLLYLALPAWWFGSSELPRLLQRHRDVTVSFTLDWPALKWQASYNELIEFTQAQRFAEVRRGQGIDPDAMLAAGLPHEQAYPRGVSIESASRIWFIIGACIGVTYLLGRWWLFRNRQLDWTWDLAMLCALTIMLSPRVQKAHMVILFAPVAWIACRIWAQSATLGWIEFRRRHPWLLISGASLACTLIAADSVPIPLPIPRVRDPYHTLQFVSLLIMIGMLATMAGQSCASLNSTSEVKPPDQGLT